MEKVQEMHCACALELLYELNHYGSMHSKVYRAYKFILILSCTQVSYERVFSMVKIVKNRLRSTLNQELYESFVLFTMKEASILIMIKLLLMLHLVQMYCHAA